VLSVSDRVARIEIVLDARHTLVGPGEHHEIVRPSIIGALVLLHQHGARPDAIAVAVAGHFIPGLWPKRHSIKLDPSALAAHAGEYQLDPTSIATVAVDGSGLSVQFSSGGAQWRMVPDSASTFFIVEDESYDHINAVVADLVELAEKFGGDYDSWGL